VAQDRLVLLEPALEGAEVERDIAGQVVVGKAEAGALTIADRDRLAGVVWMAKGTLGCSTPGWSPLVAAAGVSSAAMSSAGTA
jgi:hypothetical protein